MELVVLSYMQIILRLMQSLSQILLKIVIFYLLLYLALEIKLLVATVIIGRSTPHIIVFLQLSLL